MRARMLALAAGLLLLRALPVLPSPEPTWLLLLAGALLCLRWPLIGLCCLGLGWAVLNAHWALEERLPLSRDGATFWVEGRVAGLPEAGQGVVRFELEDLASRHAGLPPRVRLAWYGGPELHAGERWRLAVRLKRPHGLVNPQAFDYEAWLLARRIGATGTVKAGEWLSASGAGGWRDGLRQRLLALDAAGREGALAALVVGDGSGLDEADWTVLRDTGTVHLLVISGQHISLLAGLLFAAVLMLARRGWWPPGLPWLPSACLAALAGALGYGWLAGFEVPVQRACLMVACVLLWRWRFRHLGIWLPLLLALDGVLLLEPLASLQPGFWLSFAAVALLALVFGGRLGHWRPGMGLLRAQWAMSLGLLPLLLMLGLPLSPIGPLANLLAVPWVGIGVVPLALLGTLLLGLVPPLGEGLLWLAGWQLEQLFGVLRALAAWAPAWLPPMRPWWALLLAALGMLALLSPAGLPWRPLGLALLLPVVLLPAPRPAEGRAQVWVLDVGQGLAVLVMTRQHALLYDAGPRHGSFDIGERVVAPSLRSLGIDRLDRLLLSHADQDHAGGAGAVARVLRPAQVLSGEAAELPPTLQARACRRDEQWSWDGVRFRTWRWSAAGDGNQASCVLLVEAGGERLLLTGDIDLAAERALLAEWPGLRSDWLLLPHHGSRTSSSEALLEALGAGGGLISRSRHNAFGHPHAEVVARARRHGMALFDTAESGALRIELGAFTTVRGLREERRFWR